MQKQELEEQKYERRRNLVMPIDLNLKEPEAGGCVVMT